MSKFRFELTALGTQIKTARKSSYSQTFTSYTLYGGTLNTGRISYYSSYFYASVFDFSKALNQEEFQRVKSLPRAKIKSAKVTLTVNATSSTANTYYYGATLDPATDVSIPTRYGAVRRASAADTEITFDITNTTGVVDAITFGQSTNSPAYDVKVSKAVLEVETTDTAKVDIFVDGERKTGNVNDIVIDGQLHTVSRMMVMVDGQWRDV